MRRWEYSGGWKALAILLNEACAVILVLSVVILIMEGSFQVRGRPRNRILYEFQPQRKQSYCIIDFCENP